MRRDSPGRTFLGVDARAQVLLRPPLPCPCAVAMAIVMVVSIGLLDWRVPSNLALAHILQRRGRSGQARRT